MGYHYPGGGGHGYYGMHGYHGHYGHHGRPWFRHRFWRGGRIDVPGPAGAVGAGVPGAVG